MSIIVLFFYLIINGQQRNRWQHLQLQLEISRSFTQVCMHLGRGHNYYPDSDTNISIRIDIRMSMNSRYTDSHRTSTLHAMHELQSVVSLLSTRECAPRNLALATQFTKFMRRIKERGKALLRRIKKASSPVPPQG